MGKPAYQNLFQFKGQDRVGAESHSYWNLVTVLSWTVTHNNPEMLFPSRKCKIPENCRGNQKEIFFLPPLGTKIWTERVEVAQIHSESLIACGHSTHLTLLQW